MLKYAIEVATHKGATRYCKKMAVDMASLFWPPDSAITATLLAVGVQLTIKATSHKEGSLGPMRMSP